jgi:integrase
MYIVPHFGAIHLDELKPSALEKWMFDLDADGLASKTIINISSAFRTITAEAARLKIINEDPWKRVSPFYPTSKPRDVLTISEALTLLNPETTKTVWSEGSLNYLVNLTAMLTACRQGEILALRRENIHPDHLDIEASWTIRYHSRGPTKTKRKAPVPIPPYLYKILNDFVQWDGYVFSYTAGQTPATGARITDSLYRAMENIGISEADRRDRNLVFHSWRRFANTYLRGRGLPDAKVRQLTRHESETMTEHYTNWNVESFADVAKEQQSLALALVDPKVRAMLIPDDEETRSE